MRTPLSTIARIAAEVALQESPDFEVTGVTPGTGDGDYVEVFVAINGCQATPCTISLGVLRELPEAELRAVIASKLRHHTETAH